jgi:hypothetical protein
MPDADIIAAKRRASNSAVGGRAPWLAKQTKKMLRSSAAREEEGSTPSQAGDTGARVSRPSKSGFKRRKKGSERKKEPI